MIVRRHQLLHILRKTGCRDRPTIEVVEVARRRDELIACNVAGTNILENDNRTLIVPRPVVGDGNPEFAHAFVGATYERFIDREIWSVRLRAAPIIGDLSFRAARNPERVLSALRLTNRLPALSIRSHLLG